MLYKDPYTIDDTTFAKTGLTDEQYQGVLSAQKSLKTDPTLIDAGKTTPIGILSTQNAANQVQKDITKLDTTIANRGITPTQSADQNQQQVTQPEYSFIDPNTGAEYKNPKYEDVMAKNLEFSGGEAPNWFNADPRARQLEQDIQEGNKAIQDAISSLDAYKTQQDQPTQGMITNIQQMFSQRKAQMEDINMRRQKQLNTLGTRSGGERYTASFGGILAEEERSGIQRLSEIDAQQIEAENAAKQAQLDNNWKVFDKKMTLIAELQQNKQLELEELNKKAIENSNAIALQAKEEREAETKKTEQFNKDVASILMDLGKNGAPPEIVDAVSASQDIGSAIKAAGGYLKDVKSLPTSVQEYQFDNAQRAAAGLPERSYDEWLSIDANRKAKVAAAQNAGLLSSKQATLANQLSSSFEGSPVVKNFIEIQNKYLNTKANVGQGDGATDIALIYDLMKTLDPTSVVRETEYATGANRSGNIFLGALAKFNGYIDPDGGFVSDVAKQNIMDVIDRRFNSAKQQYTNLRNEKVKAMGNYGISDGGNFLTEYDFTNPNNDTAQSLANEQNAEDKIVSFVEQSDDNRALYDQIRSVAPDASPLEIAQQLGI